MGFTADEVAKMKFEWANLAKDYRVNGMCVFQALFRRYPEYQKLFDVYAPAHYVQSSLSKDLCQHTRKTTTGLLEDTVGAFHTFDCKSKSSARWPNPFPILVLKAVGNAVDCSNNDDALKNYLGQLGGEHHSRNVGKEHWSNIYPIILDQLVICNAGKVTRDVWCKFFAQCVDYMVAGLAKPVEGGPYPTEGAIRDIFQAWDTDHDGALDHAELALVMQNLVGHAMKDEEIKALIEAADTNKDGKVDFAEFLAMFRTKRT